MQRLIRPDTVEHVSDQVDGYTAIVLRDLAAAFIGEARPQTEHVAGLVSQDSIEIQRRIDELHCLEIAVAEAHGARQRQLQRIYAGDLGIARAQLAVRSEAYHPHRLARRQL